MQPKTVAIASSFPMVSRVVGCLGPCVSTIFVLAQLLRAVHNKSTNNIVINFLLFKNSIHVFRYTIVHVI